MSPNAVTHPRPRSKATLFCPDCGHESHVGGEWNVETTDGRTTTACPECGARIDDRRPDEGSRPEHSRVIGPAAVNRAVGASLTVQRRLLEWWRKRGRRLLPTAG